MKETLEAMVVPTGGMPYRKTLEADEDGSFLAALQDCVGGRIEAMGYVFGDAPAVYCNEGPACRPAAAAPRTAPSTPTPPWRRRATRARTTRRVPWSRASSTTSPSATWCASGSTPRRAMDRDIAEAERRRVMERFGSLESIASGPIEARAVLARLARRPRP